MSESYISLYPSFIALVVAIISGILSFVVKVKGDKKVKEIEHRLKLREEYDKDLRNKRIESYKVLWKIMRPLSKRSNDIVYPFQLDDLMGKMTDWYYNLNNSNYGGGFFLTEFSQKQYTEFMETIESIRRKYPKSFEPYKDDWGKDVDHLKDMASQLRTFLCKDVGVRETSENPSYYDDLYIRIPKNPEYDNILEFRVYNYGLKFLRYSYDPLLFIVPSSVERNDQRAPPIMIKSKQTLKNKIKKIFGKHRVLKPRDYLKFDYQLEDNDVNNANKKYNIIINLDGISSIEISELELEKKDSKKV